MLSILLSMALPFAASATTMSLSPDAGDYGVGDTIVVDVLLNTQNAPIDGVDMRYLTYDPSLLEVQDQNPSVAGVQIAPGSLMPVTMANMVNTTAGKIEFSQIVSGGSTFANNMDQVLATATFRVVASGTAAIEIDFTPGSTTDANVASKGKDILVSVSGSTFRLNQTDAGFRSSIQSQINKIQDLIKLLQSKLFQLFL